MSYVLNSNWSRVLSLVRFQNPVVPSRNKAGRPSKHVQCSEVYIGLIQIHSPDLYMWNLEVT
jgi:hypothetical protein